MKSRLLFLLTLFCVFTPIYVIAQEQEGILSDTNSDAMSDWDGELIFSPVIHVYYGADETTDNIYDSIETLRELEANDCMDIYTPEGQQPDFYAVTTAAAKLADWLEKPVPADKAQLMFIQQEGSSPEPKMVDRPVLDVITMAVLGISVFDLVEDVLGNLPSIPAVTKTRKTIRRTKENSKTVPVYTYVKKRNEHSISLELKQRARSAKKQDLFELDIAQAAIDGQQAIFNRQEESRLTKAIIDATTRSLEKQTNNTLRGWNLSVSSPIDSVRTLLFSLWRNIASNDLLQQILNSFWDNMKTLPPEQQTKQKVLPKGDLRNVFAGPAVLEYTNSLNLKPGQYTFIIKQKNNNGHVIKKEKFKIYLESGSRYLVINKQ